MGDANNSCQEKYQIQTNNEHPMPKLRKVFKEPRTPLGSFLLILHNYWFLVHVSAAVIVLSMAPDHGWHYTMIILGCSDIASFVWFVLYRLHFHRPILRRRDFSCVLQALVSLTFGIVNLLYDRAYWPPMEILTGEVNYKKYGGWLLVGLSQLWFLAPAKMWRHHAGSRWKYLLTLFIFTCSVGVMLGVHYLLTLPTLQSASPWTMCHYYQLDSTKYLSYPTAQYIICWIGTIGLWLPLVAFNLYSSYFGFLLPTVLIGVIHARLKGIGESSNAGIIQYSLKKISRVLFKPVTEEEKKRSVNIINFAITKSLREGDAISDAEEQLLTEDLGNAVQLRAFDVVQDVKFWASSLKFINTNHYNKWAAEYVFQQLPSLSQIVPIFEEQVLYSHQYLLERNNKRTNFQFLVNQYENEFANFHERMRNKYTNITPSTIKAFIRAYHDRSLDHSLMTEVQIWASMCGQTIYRTMKGCLSYRLVLEMYHSHGLMAAKPERKVQTLACMQIFTRADWLKKFYDNTVTMMYRLNSPNFNIDSKYIDDLCKQSSIKGEANLDAVYNRLELACVFEFNEFDRVMSQSNPDAETNRIQQLLRELKRQIEEKIDALAYGQEENASGLMKEFPFVSFTAGLPDRLVSLQPKCPFLVTFEQSYHNEPFHILTVFKNGTIHVINKETQREHFFKIKIFGKKINNGFTAMAYQLGQANTERSPLTIDGINVPHLDQIVYSPFEFQVKSAYPRRRNLRWALKSLSPLSDAGEFWQGKAVNQRNGKTMAWGEVYQTKDANQGGSVMEALKIPFVLRKFNRSQRDTIPAVIGFREKIITARNGAVGRFQAYAEWTFGTVVQRVLGLFSIRLHYGHPDFVDAEFVNGPGQMSHTNPKFNTSEDVALGYDALMNNRQSLHTDRIQDEKGRDVSLGSTTAFTTKISRGAGNITKTKEIAYLYGELDVPRKFTLFQSSFGTYVGTALMMNSVRLYLLVIILFTFAGFSESMMGSYSLVYATPWIFQIGSFTAIPLLLETAVEKTAWSMLRVLLDLPLATLFFIFQSQTMAYHFVAAFFSGKAEYIGTGRMLGLERESFTKIIQIYGDSHIKPVINLMYGIVAYYLVAETRPSGTIPMFAVLIVILVVVLVPTLFNPPAASFKKLFMDFKECFQFIFTTISITEYSSINKISRKATETTSLQELNMSNFVNEVQDTNAGVEAYYGVYYLMVSLFWLGIAMTIPGTMKDFTTLIVVFVFMYLLTRVSTIYADREHDQCWSAVVICLQYCVLAGILVLCILTELIGFYFHFALIGFFISYKLARSLFASIIYFRVYCHKRSAAKERKSKEVVLSSIVRLAYILDLCERPFFVTPLIVLFLVPSFLLSLILWLLSPVHNFILYNSSFKKSINIWSCLNGVVIEGKDKEK